MKPMEQRSNQVLLVLFLLSFVLYAVVFVSSFAELPINIPGWHQFLLLNAHCVPMFLLQLLLCRTAKVWMRLLIPPLPLVLVGLWFLSAVEWHIVGWFFFLLWCVPPVIACLAAWLVWWIARIAGRSRTADG